MLVHALHCRAHGETVTPTTTTLTNHFARRYGLASFAVATAILVANDVWLKGHPLFPPVLTGKLSDFCGLIVAPLTLVLMFGLTSLTGRLLAFVVPVLTFVAVKLDERCAEWLVAALAMTGVSWKVQADPTDVVALAIVPLAWMLASGIVQRRDRADQKTTSRPRVIPRLVTALGAVACLGSGEPPAFSAQAYLVNGTGEELEVEIGALAGRVNCAAQPDFSRLPLRDDDFNTGENILLPPDAVLPLERGCAPIRISTTGLITAVTWSPLLPTRRLPRLPGERALRNEDGLVFLERGDSVPVLRFGSGTRSLTVADASQPLPASDCLQAQQPRLELGGDVRRAYVGRIVAREPLGPSCFLLGLSVAGYQDGGTGTTSPPDASSDTSSGGPSDGAADAAETGPAFDPTQSTVTLCIPESEFPFVVGDTITVGAGQSYTFALYPGGRPSVELLRLRGTIDPATRTFAPAFGSTALPLTANRAACGYVREACGGIWEAHDVSVAGAPLTPGQRVTVPGLGASGTSTSFYFLRAMLPIYVSAECNPSLPSELWTQIELIRRLD
jgi:hypothetical protein